MTNHVPANILVVEDDLIVAEDLRDVLERAGYRVVATVADAEEALVCLTAGAVDLALLDISLKGKTDGIELAAHVRRKSLPFIFTTAHTDASTLGRASETHPYGYIVKPYSAADVRPAVEVALHKHRAEQLEKQLFEKNLALAQFRLEASQQETAILLATSEAIATIRDQSDLFAVISERLKPIFRFDHAAVVYYDKKLERFRHVHCDAPPGLQALPNYQTLVSTEWPVADSPHQEVIEYTTPRIIDLQAWLDTYPNDPGVRVGCDLQLSEAVYMPLRYGNRRLGVFEFYSREKDRFRPEWMSLFRSLADQVAVAVANILANEEVVAQERTKTLQVAVSNALSKAGSWDDRLKQVAHLIAPDMAWDMFSLTFGLSESARSYTFHRARATGEPLCSSGLMHLRQTGIGVETARQMHQHMQSHHRTADLYTGEVYEALCQQVPYHAAMRQQYGTRSLMALPLPLDLSQKGHFLLLLESQLATGFSETQFRMLSQVAPQMALVIEKMLAFENLKQRNEEKSLQLAINNTLVSIKDRNQLFGTLATEINKVIACRLFVVNVVGADGKSEFSELIERARNGNFASAANVRQVPDNDPAKSGTVHWPAFSHRPGVYVGEDFNQHPMSGFLQENFTISSALQLSFSLSNSRQAFVLFGDSASFAYTQADFNLLWQLIPQISLALDNLFAFEQISLLQKQLIEENTYLQSEIKNTHNFEEIIGGSQALGDVFSQLSKVAPTDTTVLIGGETGTGKELIARAIHNLSSRCQRPLIKINCAALPPQLIESELFGHEKGAFTGAHERRIGKFELAHQGTIFLDEIGELPLELQAKLLRVLQEREFERLGGRTVLKADVRVLVATNRDLEEEVAQGRFRADLYYRLNVFPITLPALRNRKEDIPLLAAHFVKKFAQKTGRRITGVSGGALQQMLSYHWPGNIRELEHIIERAVILSDGPTIELADPLGKAKAASVGEAKPMVMIKTLRQAERDLIIAVLNQTNGRIRGAHGAAQTLDIEPNTLEARMKKLGIIKKQLITTDSSLSGIKV
jgi:transcriptional regulator with GAF, ATPase, and Fis domain